ncbi:MAG: glycosyltransferase [Veillonella sp.]|nr:glycosyltransferase [Veillonella sp.]
MSKLTVIILAKNEEQNIVDCINSAKFADDILVIDDFSKDRTVTLAQELGARVIQHGLDGSWEQQKTLLLRSLKVNGFFSLMQMNEFLKNWQSLCKMPLIIQKKDPI